MKPRRAKKSAISVGNYRNDPLYERIVSAVDGALERGTFVTPVDVLVGMGLLTEEGLLDWRRGSTPPISFGLGRGVRMST